MATATPPPPIGNADLLKSINSYLARARAHSENPGAHQPPEPLLPAAFGDAVLLKSLAEYLILAQAHFKNPAENPAPGPLALGRYPARESALSAVVLSSAQQVRLEVKQLSGETDPNFHYTGQRPELILPKPKLTAKKAEALAKKFLEGLTLWLAVDTLWWRIGPVKGNRFRPDALLRDDLGTAVRLFSGHVVGSALNDHVRVNKIMSSDLASMSYTDALLMLTFIDNWYQKAQALLGNTSRSGQAMTRSQIVASEMFEDEDRAEAMKRDGGADSMRSDRPNEYEVMAIKPLDVHDLGALVDSLKDWFDDLQKEAKRSKTGVQKSRVEGPYVVLVQISPDGSLSCHIHVITPEKKVALTRAVSVLGSKFTALDKNQLQPPTLVDDSFASQLAARGMGTGLTVAGGDSLYHGRRGLWAYVMSTIQSALKVKQKEIKARLEELGRVVRRTTILDLSDNIQIPEATKRQKLQVIQFGFGSLDAYDEKLKHQLSLLLDRVDVEGVVTDFVVLGHTLYGANIEMQVTKRSGGAYTVELAVVSRYSSEPRYYTVQAGQFVVPSYYDGRSVMRQQPDYQTTSMTLPVGGGQSVVYEGLKSITSADPNVLFMFIRSQVVNYFVWAGLQFGERQRAHAAKLVLEASNAKDSLIAQILREDETIQGEQVEERRQREARAEKRRKELAEFRKATTAMPAAITPESARAAAKSIIRKIVGGQRDAMFANQYRFEYDAPGFRMSTSLLVARGAVDLKRYPLELMAYDPRTTMADGRFVGASQTRLDVEIDISPIEAAIKELRRAPEDAEEPYIEALVTRFMSFDKALQQRWNDWVRLVISDFEQATGIQTTFEDSITARMKVIELDGLNLGKGW